MSRITDRVAHHMDNSPQGGTLPLGDYPVPTHGYLVGGAGPALVFPSEQGMREHWDMVRAFVDIAHAAGHQYVGWWTDPKTGKVYIDCSTWHWLAASADAQAVKRGEIAFYDIERGADVTTGSVIRAA